MIAKENLSMTGKLIIDRFDANGNLLEQRNIPNLIVTTGKNLMISRLLGVTDGVMTHMGVGTGVTAPELANTALETPLSARVALTSSTQTANSATYVCTYAAGVSTGAITEAGIFNALTAGTLLCRTMFPVVNKAAGDSIVITWTITIS